MFNDHAKKRLETLVEDYRLSDELYEVIETIKAVNRAMEEEGFTLKLAYDFKVKFEDSDEFGNIRDGRVN
jgi:hypothetical protein